MWQAIAVEVGLCGWILALLVGDIIAPAPRKRDLWKLAALGIPLLAAILAWQARWVGASFSLAPYVAIPVSAPHGSMFVFDRFALLFKGLFLLTALLTILMTRAFARHLSQALGAFYLLLASALLGMLVLASVQDLLLLFIGLELLTFSLYVMAAYLKTDPRSVEAGMKYLIMGSISSGFLVYGISLVYGATGSTHFEAVRALWAWGHAPTLAQLGLCLIFSGLGFKIAAVPFHLWVPDVYEGAPTPVVAFLSVGSKMAGVVVVLRLLYSVVWPAHALWTSALAIVAAATMLYGNLGAIPQTNIKRLLGYSSIGHAGYLLMGLSTGLLSGAQAVGFYLLAYLFSNMAVFFAVVVASQTLGGDSLEDYNGLSRRSPILAATLFVGLLSLAGVPPLAGFVGKLLVLVATVDAKNLWLVAIGAVNVAISLYYYLRVVRRLYVLPPKAPGAIAVDRLSRAVLFFLMAGIVLIGVVQQPFLRVVSAAIQF